MQSVKSFNKVMIGALSKYVLILVLIISVIFFTAFEPRFISMGNLINILLQNSYMIIATTGMVIIMISGGVDLSTSWQMALSAVIMAASIMWWGLPIWIAIILGLIAALIMGTINGFLAIKFKIHPMMVTLATMTIFQGLVFIVTNSQSIYNLPKGIKFFGQGFVAESVFGQTIPVPVVIVIIVVALISFMLNKTHIGRMAYAVGSNPEASRLSGINVNGTKVMMFSLGGLLFGIASLLLLARAGSGNATMATGTEFNAITACVLGGISLKGGEGKLWGAVVGVLILGVLANGMQLIGLGIYPQYIAKGIILLGSIGFDTYSKSK